MYKVNFSIKILLQEKAYFLFSFLHIKCKLLVVRVLRAYSLAFNFLILHNG